MSHLRIPHARRGRLLPVAALALAALLPAASSVAAQPLPEHAAQGQSASRAAADGNSPAQERPAIPQARAYDKNNKPMASTEPVVRYCNDNPKGCDFKMNRAVVPLQFFSTIRSLGNAVINCTQSNITVDRTVELQTGSQDNLGGEITGSIAIEGHINATGEVTAGVNGEAHAVAKTPDQSKGPSAEAGAKGSANASGKLGAQAGLKATFSGAFKAHYNKTWTTTHTESTKYQMTVKTGDALVFGASAAMERISGTLTTGRGDRITNVVVDGPSTVNSSSFIARTDTAPGHTCDRLRP
ncbi:hypothetical protein [Streptomyces chrestomyceticus]|uniref:hypothetical protein n=1 Tax=Streptomyces chrestomyceticus TaxID=68185 RepID=UPI0019CFDF2A|nr:hypothetical protein [Streptomyces chrestomyceticus]